MDRDATAHGSVLAALERHQVALYLGAIATGFAVGALVLASLTLRRRTP